MALSLAAPTSTSSAQAFSKGASMEKLCRTHQAKHYVTFCDVGQMCLVASGNLTYEKIVILSAAKDLISYSSG